jgi:large-conductance mechanosensitive channel
MWEENIALIISFLTLASIVFAIVKGYLAPNIKQDQEILEMETACKYKHSELDKNVSEIKTCLKLLQENDLKHIEARMNDLENGQVKIATLLDERLPRK